jgi:hypothetical protein
MARIVMYNRVTEVVTDSPLELGDRLDVYRGDGPREGDQMGEATVIGLRRDGFELYVDVEGITYEQRLRRLEAEGA